MHAASPMKYNRFIEHETSEKACGKLQAMIQFQTAKTKTLQTFYTHAKPWKNPQPLVS